MRKLRDLIITGFVSSIVSFSAFGDDIEIYYGISDEAVEVNPNVVFIFDTSGSMSATDGTSSSRMFKSKEALKLALNNISGVNVSLMRFNDDGGPVLMPATDIDAIWPSNEVVRSLNGDYDFAISQKNGSLDTKFSREYLIDNDHKRAHALRFTDFNIPHGSTINSAHITYFSEYSSSEDSITIAYFGSLADDPGEFVDGSDFDDLYLNSSGSVDTTERKCNKTGVVCWKPDGWLNEDYPMNTPDLSVIVQAIVDDADWESGDPILIFGLADSKASSDQFQVFSHAAARISRKQKSPQLRIVYTPPNGSEHKYTARDKLISLTEEFVAEGTTPVVDTMYEAYLYLNGKNVFNGGSRGRYNKVRSLARLSHPDTFTGSSITTPVDCNTEQLTSYECRDQKIADLDKAKYISPISGELGQCQANYLVLFSDGEPNATDRDGDISSIIGSTCQNENCATALAEYMATPPSERSVSNNDAQVFTYTVGFESSGFDDQYLKDLAAAGSGSFYSGKTANELASAFTSIFVEAKKGSSTFVAPGISVNQFNRLTHSNDIYYALFDPTSSEYWPGNLKKYKLIDSVVQDKNEENAISSDGFFKDNAHDFWATSGSLSGTFVSRGGVSANQRVARNIYSNMANSSTPLSEEDERITASNLGLLTVDEDYRKTLIKWMLGYDMKDKDGDGETDEPRYEMSDPLHSEPLFHRYSDDKSAIFIGTNEGYLMSIDGDSGRENWAFIPEELIDNIPVYFQDGNVFNTRTYGMDGSINSWTEDGNTYIIVGQRRGGNRYHVLDITSRTSPRYKYSIEGGTGDYARLGQTWSKPTVSSIKIGEDTKKVLIFGGGYDPLQDSVNIRTPDTVGNSVFIVEASTGQKLFEISSNTNANYVISEMKYGVPARISVIDRDFDGLADHLYFGDMGGQLFRVDLYNGQTTSKLAVGKLLYSSSEDANIEKTRRFYNSPDIAEIVQDHDHYYAVSIGSGYRAHPLDETVQDSVVMIKDKGVFIKEDGRYTFPEISTIVQITPESQNLSDAAEFDGYEFNLTKGEKVLTGVSIINSRLIFSTYDPSSAGLEENSCSAAQGGGRVYIINLLDGNALIDINNDNKIDYNDSFAVLDKSGIPAEPRLIITDPDAPTICIGTECADTVESADDEGDIFKKLTSKVSGAKSKLKRVYTNSWSTEIEPTTKDDR
ncbi:hypothetical protein KO525_02670 [Psychrosphaera sp. B3R10]|uniref:PilC/PilY family type IV pilus protein n=1 Tax=unclassified Psychrosphaera TaxID=2641570 RepID=UPI001C0918FB|nr:MULTISPECIES: PilC/PilY family type IV pilus protein [unclassified Psychrosphaera]MBU2881173.1 hypothetical protein [Psychrosphaera sp. I2R16]MBU2988278.1 hypothetical protein [Psychrosphaera sp. B3R10]